MYIYDGITKSTITFLPRKVMESISIFVWYQPTYTSYNTIKYVLRKRMILKQFRHPLFLISNSSKLVPLYCSGRSSMMAAVASCAIPWIITSERISCKNDRLAQLFTTLLSVRDVFGSILGPLKSDTVSPTARHRCDVSSELCCPGVKLRRWTPPLVTRFGVIPRV